MDKPAERRLAAILHADVVGYSRLMAADEDATVRGVRELRGIAEGVVVLETAARLDPDPSDPHFRDFTFSFAYWALGRFEESVRFGERARSRITTHAGVLRVLITSEVELGRLDAARQHARDLLAAAPNFRVSLLAEIIPWQPALIARTVDALRKAGLPD